MGGVFNGLSNYTPSHRARLPAIHNVYVEGAAASTMRAAGGSRSRSGGTGDTNNGSGVQLAEQALDIRQAIFRNRTVVCNGLVLEQRMYVHRQRRSIMVLEFELLGANNSNYAAVASNCTFSVASRAIGFAEANDFKLG